MGQVTAKCKISIKDVRNFSLENFDFIDRDTDLYFTVTSDSIEGVNEVADEVFRSFAAKANLNTEDEVELEKFIK